MNKSLLIGVGVALALSSCSTIEHTASTSEISTHMYNLTVADMTVSKVKATKTADWKWNPITTVSLATQKENVTAELLKDTDADVLVEPRYTVKRRGVFRGGSVTVTGYPATYSNFRNMTKDDAEKIRAVGGGGLACVSPVISTSASRATEPAKPERVGEELSLTSSKPSVKWGIRVGVNVANLKIDDDSYGAQRLNDDKTSRTSFHVGLGVEIPFSRLIWVNTGLYYTSKGLVVDGYNFKTTVAANYLQLPVYATCHPDFLVRNLQISFGPYFAYGVGGKIKDEEYNSSYTSKSECGTFGESTQYEPKGNWNRFDFGLGVGAAYTFKKFRLGFDYQFGLVDALNSRHSMSGNTRNLAITAGFNF